MSTRFVGRRKLLGGLPAILLAPFAGLLGARAAWKPLQITAVEDLTAPLVIPLVLNTDRVRDELDRLRDALLDPATPPDRWLQCYAAQQALSWTLNEHAAESPSRTIAEGRVQLAMSWHSIKPSGMDTPDLA